MNRWIDTSKELDFSSRGFQEIINFYLFECPAGQKRDKHGHVVCTSNRGRSFEEIGITNSGKRRLLDHIKKIICGNAVDKSAFVCLTSRESDRTSQTMHYASKESQSEVQDIYENVAARFSPSSEFECAVFFRNELGMTDGFFIAIRNALAHGSFEIRNTPSGPLYLFENRNDEGMVRAIIRLKESSLFTIIRLVDQETKKNRRKKNRL